MNITALFVDNDQHMVSSFKRNIRSKEITILTASNGEEALNILKSKSVHVLITDIHMPKINGIKLISHVADIYPQIIRIAISGEADIEDIKQLINRGHIWQYIEKPFSMGHLFVTIKNAYTLYLERQERLELVKKLDRKSKELEELNEKLEEIVAERTKQLDQRTNILQMIVTGDSIETICNETAKALCQTSAIDNVIIHSPHLVVPFSLAPLPIPESVSKTVAQITHSDDEYVEDFYLTLPLVQHDEVIGTITVHTNDDSRTISNDIREKILFFAPLLTMSLSHSKLLSDLPDLMEDIEEVLGSLDNE